MPEFNEICFQLLSATIHNYNQYLNSESQDLDSQHKFLTQTAIIQQVWDQIQDKTGYKNKELLARAFRELENKTWLTSKKGKQNAILYFPTNLGLEQVGEIMNQDLSQAKCFIDGANVAMYPNRSSPTLQNVKVVIRALKNYFDIKPISIYVIWKPALRHYLPEAEKEEFGSLEKQGVIIQSFRGKGEKDDIVLLRYADEFRRIGQEIWIVTNDSYSNHLDEFAWFKNFPNKIEFRILEHKVLFDPPSVGAPRITDVTIDEKQEGQTIIDKEPRITLMSQMPTDSEAMTINDINEFLELAKSNKTEQIFQTQQYLWFMLQGRLVRHTMRPALSELKDFHTYLYCQKWYLRNEEEYQLWTQDNLENKGWPIIGWYQSYLKTIESTELRFGSSSASLKQKIQDQWNSVREKYVNQEPPDYEKYCANDYDWQRWLIAKENGWPSFETLLNTTYDLIDLDLLAEDRSFCAEIINSLITKSYEEFSNLKREEFRRQIWLPFLFKTDTNEIFYQRRTQTNAQVIVEELRTGDFGQFQLEEEILMNKAQMILWFIAKQNGWKSYRALLEKAKTFLPIGLWKDFVNKKAEKSKDLERYSDEIRSRLKLPFWKFVFDPGKDFARAFLIVLAGLSKEDLANFNVEIDPYSGKCLFRIGSQQFEEFSKNQRDRW